MDRSIDSFSFLLFPPFLILLLLSPLVPVAIGEQVSVSHPSDSLRDILKTKTYRCMI